MTCWVLSGISGISQAVMGADQIMLWLQSTPRSQWLNTTKVPFSLMLHFLVGWQRGFAYSGPSDLPADGEGRHDRGSKERTQEISRWKSNPPE